MNWQRLRLKYWLDLFHRNRLEQDLDEEIKAHVALDVRRRVEEGESPDAARVAALRDIRSVTYVQESTRDAWAWRMLRQFAQDVRFGFRMLGRSPGFSVLAILCLTLGIGANTAVYSWIEGILLRPFPAVTHQDRMMAIAGTVQGTAGEAGNSVDISWPDFVDLQRNTTLFDWFIMDRITGTTLSIGDRAQRATGSIVSSNYFDAIGVHPIMGRGFEPSEDAGRNAHPVTVISYQMWKDRFKGDPEIIGKTQMLNGMPHTIVGVAPKGFYGTFVGWAMQFWVPASMQEKFDRSVYKLEDRGARWVEGYVRLKPGVTADQAQAEISAAAKQLENDYPATNRGRGVKLFPLWQTPFNNAGTLLPTLGIAVAVVFLVLLIACANVSNLLLVRAFRRRHEMTVRLAIGSGRSRLLRQLLTEGLILSALATAGGLIVANWCRNLLALLLPSRAGVTMNLPGEIDWRVLALSAGVCVVSTVVFGLVPVIQTGKIDLASALKAESSGVVRGQRALIRSSLVLVQISLSFVLLVGAGLVLHSVRMVQNTDPGFSTQNVLATWVDLVSAGYDKPRSINFQDELIGRLQAVSGVESVAFEQTAPFGYVGYPSAPIAVDGYETVLGQEPTVDYNVVGPAYLSTTGIPLVSGREFTRADNETAAPVAVVNETMAAQYWRGQDPVGSRLQVKGRWMQVIGVAKTSKYWRLQETPKPFFYLPMRQNSPGSNLNIRTSLGPETMMKVLAREVHAIDANLAPGEVITMREQVDRTTAIQRVALMMLGVFGGLALILAAIGLYGVMSYTVSQNTREMALRMALGASASDVLRLVLLHGLALTAGGIALGAPAALGLTRLIGDLLYKVSPRDPVAFGSALVVIAAASLAASLLPAWRAMRTDPMRALRS